jgi:hypothetical protein
MANSKYEVVSQTVEGLLSLGTAQFEVPPFQRTYSWGTDEINQLIEDVFGESPELHNNELPYFLGSIVLATKENGASGPDLILDGQQRITTLSLIISVLIHKLDESGTEDVSDYRAYLVSRRVRGQSKPKILLQDEDRRVYESLIREPSSYKEPRYKSTSIGVALARIYTGIDRYVSDAKSKSIANDIYGTMLERILYDVEIVRITAPSEKDAFRLFETLNDRGLALSAADLIKNKLFSQCGSEIEDATDSWANVVACTKDDDIVDFLRYYWIASHSLLRKRALYDKYRSHINTLGSTEAALLAIDLDESARNYEQMVNPNPKTHSWGQDVASTLERLNTYRARGCRPVILACSKFRLGDITKIAYLCESITVRHSIVGERSSNRLEYIYAEICKALRNQERSLAEVLAKDELLASLREIPSDDEFVNKLETMEILSITPAWREILTQINSKLGTGETTVGGPSRVHVEHILPQTPRATVLTESYISVDEAARLVSRIGNLTLLSGRKNREASNKPFSAKRDSYAASDIPMTRQLASFDRWSEEQIQVRSRKLAELAAEVYPHPTTIIS